MQKIAINYGLKMFAGFTGLFLIAHLLGGSDNYNLRILNGVIHFAFLYFAIREYRQEFPETHNNYISGVSVGMYASMIGVVLFTLFMLLFFVYIDPDLFMKIQANSPSGEYFNQFTVTLYIFTEGIVVSLIGSYLIMRIIDAKLEGKLGKK